MTEPSKPENQKKPLPRRRSPLYFILFTLPVFVNLIYVQKKGHGHSTLEAAAFYAAIFCLFIAVAGILQFAYGAWKDSLTNS